MRSSGRTIREIEVKLRVADVDALIRKLGRLGCRCAGRVLERNTLFDTPDSDIRRRGRLLRIRVETPAPSKLIRGGARRTVITSKSPAPASAGSRFKEKLEREVAVRSPRNWLTALRPLGFRPGFAYEKFRSTFRLPGLHLDLDETPVGAFLELEGSSRAIDRAAKALGFSRRDYIRGTYWDVYVAECRRRGRSPRNMLFSS
jgi:adenylate cyclase class 2